MPLKRTPSPSQSASPSTSAFATPLQHYHSDNNISEIGQEAGLSAASSASSLKTISSVSKASSKKGAAAKRKRAESNDPGAETMDTIKLEIKDMFKAFQKQQDAKFEILLSSISDLKMSMEFMSSKYEEVLQRIDLLESESKNDKNYIQHLENRIDILDRNARSSSIEMRNIPLSPKETKDDLKNMICSVAQLFNISLGNKEIKDIYRANTKAAVKPIIADFTTVLLRDSFLSSFKAYNKEHRHSRLSTSDINIKGPSMPVYFSENLTQRERKLFYLAREFSKSHGYSFCWTSFGRVFIRRMEGSPQIRIFAESDFDKLREK